MKRFLDSSVLVESCLRQSPKFAAADALVNEPETVTSAHALAEAYATLSGDARLKINPADAARMVQPEYSKYSKGHISTFDNWHTCLNCSSQGSAIGECGLDPQVLGERISDTARKLRVQYPMHAVEFSWL